MTAITAAMAMAAGSIFVGAGTASAATTVSQAQGRFLSGSALTANLDDIAELAAASAVNDGSTVTVVDKHPLSATVLNGVTADLGSGLNLFGENGLITLGAVNQYASASNDGSSSAASGAVDDNGAVAAGGADGTQNADATVDLGKLLGSSTVLGDGSLQVGAVSATATETAAGAQSGTYKIASLKLNITSPVIPGLTSSLKTVDLPALLDALSLDGATFGNVPDPSGDLSDVAPVTSADGSIVVDIRDGAVSIDVAKVLTTAGLDLDDLPPNTEILGYVVAALDSQLVPAITTAVNGLADRESTAIGDITVTGTTLTPEAISALLGGVATTVTDPITDPLSGLGKAVATPIGDTLTDLLSLIGNGRSTTAGAFTQTALRVTLVPAATPLALVDLASATVGANEATVSAPTAASLAPNRGPVTGGTDVVITGTGFVPGETSVSIGRNTVTAADVTVNATGTTATFSTPAHVAGPVEVKVITGAGASAATLGFTYDALSAQTLSPNHGPVAGGTAVTVNGSGFVPGATTVSIGGITIPAASVTIDQTGTTATFTTPAHAAGPAQVTLTTAGGTTAPALTYTFDPGAPTGVSLSPNHGPAIGGTAVTIAGTGFVQGSTSVTIGGTTIPATAVTVSNGGTTATFTTPAHPVGTVPVTVTTGGGTTTPPLTFTYDRPTAQAISPNTGPTTGGNRVTVTGSGFVAGQTSVTIGGATVPASAVTVTGSTSLTFSAPAHPVGPVGVTVSTPQGNSTPALGYYYSSFSCVLTGGNAATVTVDASVGATTALVRSNFAVTVGGKPVGTATPVTPLAGGILQAQASVPVPAGTTTVGFTLTAVDGGFTTVVGGPIACTPLDPGQREAGIYHPLQSARLLDTRKDVPLKPGATYTLQVLGRGGIPATKVASLVANVTVTEPTKPGYLTVYPDGSRPNTSSINFAPAQTVANLMTAPVGADGKIRIFNGSSGTTHVLVDVSGYFSSGDTVAPGSYRRLDPVRILDTNKSVGVPTSTPVPANGVLTLKVTGVGGVQATNVSAVALNLTVDQTTKNGYITVFKSGVAPNVSSLNFLKGQTDANLVIAPVAADGTIKIRNTSQGTVRLIADVSGYFLGGVAILDGEFVAVSPGRVLDTRKDVPVQPLATISPTMVGRNAVPPTHVSAVVLNVTVDRTTGLGFITVFPHDPKPNASNLNFVAGQPRPNSVIAPLGSDGKVRMFNGSQRPVDLIADVSGYFISNPLG